ncbi:MAG: protein kinase [Verrucomicrobiota bacterium]
MKTRPPRKSGPKIIRKLAEGGQGEVFLAERNGKLYALKLYNKSSATQEQKNIISYLVSTGVPVSSCADRLVWPFELIEIPGSKRFGYLMPLIDTDRYITLRDVKSRKAPHPGYAVMAEVCRQLAETFRALHNAGHCYRDISDNNFYFDPKIGDILICDNDNCMVDQLEIGHIEGTAGFMAPEVMLGHASPSTLTDQHSLAVLLFEAWHLHNPLHGLKEYNIGCFDAPAQELIYGKEPVFIFDPKNRGNALPNDAGYRIVPRHWNLLPIHMRRLFTRAFTKGLRDPAARITELEWMHAFQKLLNHLHACPSCGAENFWDPEETGRQACWNKQCDLALPLKLFVKGKPANSILAKPGKKLTTLHLGECSSSRLIGMTEPHPSDTNASILRNKTTDPWKATLAKQVSSIPEGKAVVLTPGLHLHIEGYELVVKR